jgi:hypothetical protein
MLQLSSYQPSAQPKNFDISGREIDRVKISHSFIDGFRHTMAYLVKYDTGAFFLKLSCAKSSCKHSKQHELLFPISEPTALLFLGLYCSHID